MVAVEQRSALAPRPRQGHVSCPPARSATISLVALRAVMPSRCFRPHEGLALLSLLIGGSFFAATTVFATWVFVARIIWLYPISWGLSGMAFTSLFVLGHDCGHFNLLRSKPLMVALGHFLLLPAGYPFYAWKYSHDAHHSHVNRLEFGPGIYFDNAWLPLTVEAYANIRRRNPFFALVYRWIRTCPPFGSLLHLFRCAVWAGSYRPNHRRGLYVSYLFLLGVGGVTATGLVTVGGFEALFHFWLVPAVLFQVWMGTYTFVHHTSEDIPCLEPANWLPATAQLGTVNCRLPEWISRLHFRIDIHVPHHVSTAIPSYRLIEANAALLRSAFGPQVRELPLTLGYVHRQSQRCQLWDREQGSYVSIADATQA